MGGKIIAGVVGALLRGWEIFCIALAAIWFFVALVYLVGIGFLAGVLPFKIVAESLFNLALWLALIGALYLPVLAVRWVSRDNSISGVMPRTNGRAHTEIHERDGMFVIYGRAFENRKDAEAYKLFLDSYLADWRVSSWRGKPLKTLLTSGSQKPPVA